jgi:hypothetical protein
VKRRDPWPRANAPSKAAADPELSGEDATKRSHRRVLTWFASRWRNHQPKRAEKPHLKFSGRKALDGPATRPQTPLAVENSVGKLAAPARVAPNASPGKREWRTPIPHLSLLDRKVGQGLIVLGRETTNIERPTPHVQFVGIASHGVTCTFKVGCQGWTCFQPNKNSTCARARLVTIYANKIN